MIWLLAIAAAATVSAGIYMALSRDLLRSVVGISVLAAAANLIVFASARAQTSAPPIIAEGSQVLEHATNPLPQALVLTAIVIGFSLTCFSLILVLAIKQRSAVNDSDLLRSAEPAPREDGYPVIEEAEK